MNVTYDIEADKAFDLIEALRQQPCVVAFLAETGVAVELTSPFYIDENDPFLPALAANPNQRRKNDPEAWATIDQIVSEHGGVRHGA